MRKKFVIGLSFPHSLDSMVANIRFIGMYKHKSNWTICCSNQIKIGTTRNRTFSVRPNIVRVFHTAPRSQDSHQHSNKKKKRNETKRKLKRSVLIRTKLQIIKKNSDSDLWKSRKEEKVIFKPSTVTQV